jgi:hypothetical protein
MRSQVLVEVTVSHQLWEASRGGARMTRKQEVIPGQKVPFEEMAVAQ